MLLAAGAASDAQSVVDTQLAQAALEENLTHHAPVPPPAMFPLDEAAAAAAGSTVAAGSSVFPLSTWHAELPATGLPSLERWTAQGLAPSQRARIDHIISVYSLGFHQVRFLPLARARSGHSRGGCLCSFMFLCSSRTVCLPPENCCLCR